MSSTKDYTWHFNNRHDSDLLVYYGPMDDREGLFLKQSILCYQSKLFEKECANAPSAPRGHSHTREVGPTLHVTIEAYYDARMVEGVIHALHRPVHKAKEWLSGMGWEALLRMFDFAEYLGLHEFQPDVRDLLLQRVGEILDPREVRHALDVVGPLQSRYVAHGQFALDLDQVMERLLHQRERTRDRQREQTEATRRDLRRIMGMLCDPDARYQISEGEYERFAEAVKRSNWLL
ncbi:unnamed protein product [Zymoseptoria tritici ST99CH_3D1]|nr:unnamed protein product [Zymoseptoria tritici ST99CH_3D1]